MKQNFLQQPKFDVNYFSLDIVSALLLHVSINAPLPALFIPRLSSDLSFGTSMVFLSTLPPPLFPPLLLYSHLTSLLLLLLLCLSKLFSSPLSHLSSYWTRSQFPARPQGSFPVCSGAGGNLSRETNCLVAASCEHLAQLGMRSEVTPPETKCGHLHRRAQSTHNTHPRQCCHLPSTTMGHKVMWCKMINELV